MPDPQIPLFDLYRELEVDPNASFDVIAAAYRSIVKRFHPDVADNREIAEARIKRVNVAYEWLSDARQRARYDASQGFDRRDNSSQEKTRPHGPQNETPRTASRPPQSSDDPSRRPPPPQPRSEPPGSPSSTSTGFATALRIILVAAVVVAALRIATGGITAATNAFAALFAAPTTMPTSTPQPSPRQTARQTPRPTLEPTVMVTASPSPTVPATATAAPIPLLAVGSWADVGSGGRQVGVMEVRQVASTSTKRPIPGYVFIRAFVRVRSISENIQIYSYAFRILDRAGNAYSSIYLDFDDATLWDYDPHNVDQLLDAGWISFEVPVVEADSVRLQFQTDPFGDEDAGPVWDL